MDDLTLISTGLYRHVNNIVGSESLVSMRRTVMDIHHEMKNVYSKFDEGIEACYLSGSEAEGLRFKSSDRDWMFINRNVRVVFCRSPLPRCNNVAVLLAESQGMRPGFYLLRLVSNTTYSHITNTCVYQNNRYYVSSALWRSRFLFRESHSLHGPCTSVIIGRTEYDFAHCVKSEIWPDAALGCIQRLRHAGWPSQDVISEIVKGGCLFVPIGSKYSPYEEYEWRLSFSLAEKILLHNMTHTQFLTYGLLKIFLKEAIDINQDVKGLLCSYFMKTILFWKQVHVQEFQCSERNFLFNFWQCLETLISYVISGYCPNFFIPENNMFRGKIEGVAQRKLLSHLTSLYRTGYDCLLQCPSLKIVMNQVRQQPTMALMLPNDQMLSTKSIIDTQLIGELWNRHIPLNIEHRVNVALLLHAELLLCNSSSETASFVVNNWMKLFLPELCVMLLKHKYHRSSDSQMINYKIECRIMKVIRSSSSDAVVHLLYAAIALYHSGKFATVVDILKEAKRRLQHPCLIYPWSLDNDKYRAAGGETTPIRKMLKTVVAFPVVLGLNTCIRCLDLEHEAAFHHSVDAIAFPPLVIANFLLYLCYRNERRIHQSNAILDELCTLVHYDDGYHIHDVERAISWQLLGICQEMSGDYQGAFYSYNTATQQRWCHIKSASERRMRNVFTHLTSGNI